MSEYPRTTRLVSESKVFSAAERWGRAFARAWRVHPTRRLFDRTWQVEDWQRLRLIGWMLIVAMLTTAVAQLLLSPRGLVGLAGQAILLGIGVALFTGCRAWACAWKHRRARTADRRA